MMGLVSRPRRDICVCEIDVSHTVESLHAHVSLDRADIQPGDSVLLHDAPPAVAFGDRVVCRGRATILRASLAKRVWTRAMGYFALTELYEVGFAPRRKP